MLTIATPCRFACIYPPGFVCFFCKNDRNKNWLFFHVSCNSQIKFETDLDVTDYLFL